MNGKIVRYNNGLCLFFGSVIFCLLSGAVGHAEDGGQWKTFIADKFEISGARQPQSLLDATVTSVGSAVWAADQELVFAGEGGLGTKSQQNAGGYLMLGLAEKGLMGKPLEIRCRVVFSKNANTFWFGFGRGTSGRQGLCTALINAKEGAWILRGAGRETTAQGSVSLSVEENNFTLRYDPKDGAATLVVNGETVVRGFDVEAGSNANPTSALVRFHFLSQSRLKSLEILARE